MSSPFDDLLGDFGDSTTTTTTTTKSASNGDNELLLDFTTNSEITNGQAASNGVSSSSTNPLYDFDVNESMTSPSANPLYEFDDQQPQQQSSNPLYDFSSDFSNNNDESPPVTSSANPLYDFAAEEDTTSSQQVSDDPFHEFENLGAGGETEDSSVDLLSGTNQQEETSDNMNPSNDQVDSADLLGDFGGGDLHEQHEQEESIMMQEGDSGIQEISGSSEANGNNSLLDLGVGVDITPTSVQEQEEDEEDAQQEEAQNTQEEIQEVGEVTNEEVEEEQTQPQIEEVEQELEEEQTQPQIEEVEQELEEEETQPQVEADEEVTQEEGEEEEGEKDVATTDTLPDLIVTEDGDEVADEGPQEGASSDVPTQDHTDEYLHDRREEALEQYCIDRDEDEESSEIFEGYSEDLVSGTKGDDVEESVEEKQEEVKEETRNVEEEEGKDQVDEDAERDQFSSETFDQQAEDQLDHVEETPVEDAAPEVVDEHPETLVEDDVSQQPDEIVEPEEASPPAEAETDKAGPTAEEEPEVIEDNQTVTKTTPAENRYSSEFEETNTTTQEYETNQWPQETSEDPDVVKETPGQDIEHFSEMSSVMNKFQSGFNEPAPQKQPVDIRQEVMASEGGVYESEPQTFQQWENEDEEEEGVYENEPVRRDDLVRETDAKEEVNLPSPGLTQNLLAKFKSGDVQSSTPRAQREVTPPNPTMGGGEYVSEPRVVFEKYEGKADAGVFESEPQRNPAVVRSDSCQEDSLPEQGSAKKFAARFAQLDTERKNTVVTSQKKELTPDRSASQVEYVSEPRGVLEQYEGKAESGVFESQPEYIPDVIRAGDEKAEEPVPERGTAKNLALKFHQISVDNAAPVASRGKREITPPDSNGQHEYVSEPRSHLEKYEAKTDSGVFENTPQEDPEVIKSESLPEDYVPERGYAKNVAAKFKELENTAKSPPLSPGRKKEITPPREADTRTSGVYESTPETKPDVVTSTDAQEEVLPGAGTARSLAQRYKEIVDQNKTPVTSKPKKEFTPPPQQGSGVYESQPDKFEADYNRPAESGILENQPTVQRDDVLRGSDNSAEVELPETGSARNLVSKWRQIESESAKNTSPGSAGGRHKEFTPPREEPRIMQNSKSPRTPKSPSATNDQLDNGSVHPSDLPGQYQPQNEPHVFESNPEPHPEALRESDTDWSAGMPKKNQAKKMLARFQNIQAEANKEQAKPVPRKQEPKAKSYRKVGRSKSMRAAIQVEKCGACDKTVYAMERLEMNKRVYHRACFRCSQCKNVLTPKTFAINNGIIFCTTHYKQNFTTKGNYDEGFGRQQHKKQWSSNPNLAGAANGDEKASGTNEAEVRS